ncbi:hypothetical protein [Flavobacterium sp. 3HN19-14]|uniref:hypothetical protein n=1 Tax=Flavobacterium sp. 3HN19-14 TaxID=3448133 RepID=UPI003EDFB346
MAVEKLRSLTDLEKFNLVEKYLNLIFDEYSKKLNLEEATFEREYHKNSRNNFDNFYNDSLDINQQSAEFWDNL